MYLTIISVLSFIVSLAILLWVKFSRKEKIRTYLLTGITLAIIDFIVEYLGTTINAWIYKSSIFLLIGLIPVELVFLFFSLGVMAHFVYRTDIAASKKISLNTILFVIILLSIFVFLRDVYRDLGEVSLLLVAIPVGLWGLNSLPDDEKKKKALAVAVGVTFVDAIAETLILGRGEYSYYAGFAWTIPIIYGLGALGIMAIADKYNGLEPFLNIKTIRRLLKLVGITGSSNN